MRRKAAADVDALRVVDVVASFQLDSLVVVRALSLPMALTSIVSAVEYLYT